MQVARSSNVCKPFGDLEFWRSRIIGSTGVFDFLLRNEVDHVPVGQRDFVLVSFAEFLFLGERGWG